MAALKINLARRSRLFIFYLSMASTTSVVSATDPLTITSLSPNQASAYASAESSYLAQLTTGLAFSTLTQELLTDSRALDQITRIAGILHDFSPQDSKAMSQASDMIALLPSGASSFYESVLAAEISIASSVVNRDVFTTTFSTVSTATVTRLQPSEETSSASPPTTTASGTKLGTGVGALVLIVALVIFAGFMIYRRRKRAQRARAQMEYHIEKGQLPRLETGSSQAVPSIPELDNPLPELPVSSPTELASSTSIRGYR